VSDYELASRLSYFLWSSMPDDALFGVASQGTLHQDAVLGAQIQRMLADPRATAMADVFAAQWLQLTVLDNHQPDPTLFPTVTPQVIQSMESETKLFFTDLLDNGGALHSLLDANYTFVDSALAQHYGLPAPTGTGFVKTSLDGTTRIGGLLGHASILTATSGLQHTSAVKRGAWVLGNILCAPPPPPPASVQQMLQANAQQVTMLTNQLTQRSATIRSIRLAWASKTTIRSADTAPPTRECRSTRPGRCPTARRSRMREGSRPFSRTTCGWPNA
jgi:hypothetical protein